MTLRLLIRPLVLIGLGLLLTLIVSPRLEAAGEVKEAERRELPENMLNQPVDRAGVNHYLNIARDLMRQRNYEGAAGLLETILSQQPENAIVLNLLRNCYDQIGQYAKTELIIRRMIELSPGSHVLQMYLGEALTRQGDTAAALAAFETAVDKVRNGDPGQYRQVVNSMQRVGLNEPAMKLIDDVRGKLDDPSLMALEAGEILESRRRYGRAADEFFSAMADTTRRGTEAESKLLSLLKFEESQEPAEAAVRAHLDDTTGAARATRVLSTHYTRSGQLQEAMHFVLLEDSLVGGNGVALLNFLRICNERKLYNQAVVVGEELIRRYPASPLLSEGRFVYADALTHLGRFDEAIAVYDTIIATYPRIQDKSRAGYEIGKIHLDYRNDIETALSLFDSVVTAYPGGPGYFDARMAIPNALMRQGKLDSARAEFARLADSRFRPDAKEEIYYQLALLSFFNKQYDSTRTRLNKLLVDYPRGFYFNDALQLLLVLDEAENAPQLLYDYSNALLFRARRMTDSTAARLERIAAADNDALADVALYELIRMSLSHFDSTAALDYIGELDERFPESYYLPFGMKIKGDMFLSDPARQEEGKEIYRWLLENHPNYPFISEVRKKLRELEVDARTG